MRGSGLALALLLLPGGCLSLPGATSHSDGGPDGSVPTGCIAPVIAGDFEMPDDTTGWLPPQGTLEWIAGGRDGSAGAAEVCKTDATAKNNTIKSDGAEAKPMESGTYRMSGWARVPSGDPAQVLHTRLRLLLASGSPAGTLSYSEPVTVGQQWRFIDVTLGISVPNGDWVEGSILNLEGPDGSCFVADDLCFELVTQGR